MTSSSTYDWIAYVEKALLECDEIPLMGPVPSFDFDALTQSLKQVLGLEDLKVKPGKWTWYSPQSLADYNSNEMVFLNFSVLPIQGKVTACLSPMDVNSLISWIVEKKASGDTLFDSQFKQGLLSYVSVAALSALQGHPFFDGFLMRYLPLKIAPSSRCLALDLQIVAFKETLNVKIFIPETFRRNWIQHFLQRPTSLSHSKLNQIELKCGLQLGHFYRSVSEFKEIKLGDFIPVSNIQVNPKTHSGSLTLTVGQKPLFRVRLKDKGFKILEQSHYAEEAMSIDDEDFINDFSEPSEEYNEEEIQRAEEPEEMGLLEEDEETESEASVPQKEVTLEKISEVALNVSVELTRFNMTCSKLLQLKPGNLLELDIPPEKPVDLVINGKVVAQGELIHVGEVIGVRILDIR